MRHQHVQVGSGEQPVLPHRLHHRELERMRLRWGAKDLDSVERLGRDIGRPMPVAAMCRSRMP